MCGAAGRGQSKAQGEEKGWKGEDRGETAPQGSLLHQLSISDTRTELRQAACTQEAEVPGFCDLNAAFPPAVPGRVLVCPTVLLRLVPARASDSSNPLSPLTPIRLLLIGPLNPPNAVSPENQNGYAIQWAEDHDKQN